MQIKNLVGYSTASSNRVYIQIYYIFKNIRGFQWQEFVMGGLLLLLLFFFQFLSNRHPRCDLGFSSLKMPHARRRNLPRPSGIFLQLAWC